MSRALYNTLYMDIEVCIQLHRDTFLSNTFDHLSKPSIRQTPKYNEDNLSIIEMITYEIL